MFVEHWKELRRDIKLRKDLLNIYKVKHGCAICGYNKCAAALVFHHKDKDNKENGIAQLVNSCFNFKEVLKEIGKCTVLCANCHRELHDKERKV